MDIKELEMILKEGEGYKIEFKEGFNNLDKEIVAFVNSSGGKIFLGVTDEGKIKGIGISNELKSRIQDIANNCRPKIKISIDIFEKIIFNNAGVLFFAKEPQRFIPWSVFTVALFKDYGGADIIDRKEVEGSLFEIVEEVMKFVRLYSKVAYRFTGMPQRENIYEYPFEAIREAVINSVMHKYYFEHGHNNILKFFPDRIKIENYWQEPPNFILGETVFRRNHIIADLFVRINFGEKMGSGLERIKEICKKENAPFPEIEFNPNYFYVTFRQSREYLEMAQEENVKETLAVVLTERQERAIEYLRENVFITTRVYASLADVSERQARYDLNDLVEKNLIIAEGATTARKYRLRQTSVKEGGEMSMEGGRRTGIGEMLQQRHGTRMTRIGQIFTDLFNPCVSASSAQSVFHRIPPIIDDDKKPQMNADERRFVILVSSMEVKSK